VLGLDDSVFASEDTPDELVDVLADDVVVRCLTGIPPVETMGQKGASREQHHPLGSAELGRSDLLPAEPSDFGEHRYAVEPIDRMVLAGGGGEHDGIEQVATRDERRPVGKRLAPALSPLGLSHPQRHR
jgi:hypothetical protein